MRYTCLVPGCDWKNDEHDNIRDILEHEKIHPKEKTDIIRTEKEPCNACKGKGYIESKHIVEVDSDVPKTN